MFTIRYFAGLKEKAGKSEEVIEREKMTVKELQEWAASTYEGFDEKSIRVAINEEYAQSSDIIKSGDTVAFIPPVSGG